MTDPDFTAIALLVDRSGSMATIASDAEGALEAFIVAQRKLPGRCTVRLSDFESTYRSVYGSVPIADTPYYRLHPRGSTALLDSIGRLVTEFGQELAELPEDARPGTVIVVIQTDGIENASTKWTRKKIFALLTEQQTTYGWKLVYLGANQDAIAIGADLGFTRGSTLTYAASPGGMSASGQSLSSYVSKTRTHGSASFTDEERNAAENG